MSEEPKDIILSKMRSEILSNYLKNSTRFDGRALDEFRSIIIEKGVVDTAEGSALVKLGTTKALASIKFDILTPFPDKPREGVLMANAEFLPAASPTFEGGPPGEDSIELARVVDRGIRSAEAVDFTKFFIEEEKVLGLFVDLYILDHGGNLIDAAALAATSALLNTKFPKIEDGKIIRGEYTGNLEVRQKPICTTFIKVGNYWLIDPDKEEETVMDTKISISTTAGHVCSIQKTVGSLSKQELMDLIDSSFSHGAEIRKHL